jgi:hypothetical protein
VRYLTKESKGIQMTTRTDASLTTIIPGEPVEKSEAPATPAFRLRKSFAAVQFEPAGKGRIVFLPEGAELHVVGPSRMGECCEVRVENQLYNIFRVDLSGPWATPIKPGLIQPSPIQPRPLKPIPALAAMGACA